MEVNILVIIVTIFCHRAAAASNYSRLIFDLTRPITQLLNGEISENDFVADIDSAHKLIGANITNSTLFYTATGGTIEKLESQTINACQIVTTALERSANSQLLISWPVNYTTLKTLGRSFYNNTFDGCKPLVLFNLYNVHNCDEIEFHSLPDWFFSGTFVGLGFHESLLNCNNFHVALRNSKLHVVNINFGSTEGVTESFGLFQTGMKFLSERMQGLDFNDPSKPFLYFPNPESVGGDKHQHLLTQYASLWTTSNKNGGSMVIQVPNSRNVESTTAQFTIIPEVYASKKIPWSSILLFSSFKQQPPIIMDEDLWDSWKSRLKTFNHPYQTRKYMPTDAILSYMFTECDDLSNRTKFNESIFYQPENVNVGPPSTMLFSVYNNREKEQEVDYVCPTVHAKFIKGLTSKPTVGCAVLVKSFQTLIESNVSTIMSACRRINGSLYLLATSLETEWYNENENSRYSFYYENTVRAELHALNRFRKAILRKEPHTKVYLAFFFKKQFPTSTTHALESSSLFCNELATTVNQYLEGLVNWAKLESFPALLGFSFGDTTGFFGPWFSWMRRYNYPYKGFSVEGFPKNQTKLNTISPSFLMQDYLKSTHNWQMDTCIDWTYKRWDMVDNFFHNNKIGAVYQLEGLSKTWTIEPDAYSIMLQFIFFRFRLVLFGISGDFPNLLTEIEHTISSKNFSNVEIFINYDIAGDLSGLQSFLVELKRSKIYETNLLKGLHTKLLLGPETPVEGIVLNFSNLETVSRMIKLTKPNNIYRGIELPSVEICNEMLAQFILNSSTDLSELICNIDYIVCKETSKHLSIANSKLEWESMLDYHLVTKRLLGEFVPHLQVYFRVEFDFNIGQNSATMDQYTNMLALFKTFGTVYDIGYFVVDAFDNEIKNVKNGWWGITNYSDLTNPKSYVEKGTVLRGQQMWYPQPTTRSRISEPEKQDSLLVIIFSSVSSAVLIILVILGICFGLRYRKLSHLSRFLSDGDVQEFLHGRVATNTEPASIEMELMASSAEHMKFNQEYKLNFPDLTIDFEKILGTGAFGTVYKGMTKDHPAAIKCPNRNCSKTTFKSVLTEVKVLSYIGNHPNVVGFLGAYIDEIHKGVLYISTELCHTGSLETFLRKKVKVISEPPPLNQNEKIETDSSILQYHVLNTFSMEIGQGMEYIESRRVVHGDLSTRNVLLDGNLVCKIGDFGLSRKLYEYEKYVKTSQEPLPWKWMAPESLAKMEFTSKSDIWSYGVTLWEIYSLGNIPYAGLNWTVGFSKDLQNGLRLKIPDFATAEIYEKMKECWNLSPDDRPTFTDIVIFFKSFNQDAYIILDSTE